MTAKRLGYRQRAALRLIASQRVNRNQGRVLIGLGRHQIGRGYRPFNTLADRGLITIDQKTGIMDLTDSGQAWIEEWTTN